MLLEYSRRCNFFALVFVDVIQGEAREFGYKLLQLVEDLIKEIPENVKKAAFIGSGEFTVSVKGEGVGGRNQEMLLAFLVALRERNGGNSVTRNDFLLIYELEWLNGWRWGFISTAFDGIEGNSGAMGAYVGPEILDKVHIETDELKKEIENNNSHAVWEKYGTVLKPGYTGTNVNDVTLLLFEKC